MEDGRVTGRYALDGPVVVGRAPTAGILIHDPAVSREHARIEAVSPDLFEIEDLGSRNGTFVNGVRIRKVVFRLDDVVTLGRNVLLRVSRIDPVKEEARRRERLEALGRLTAGVVHDLNNMLGALLATAEAMGHAVEGDPELEEYVDDMQAIARRAAELTPRLMGFARGDSFRHASVEFSNLCNELVAILRRTFDPLIEIDADVASGLLVDGDAGELHQALMNVCLNARDAMLQGGTLTIRVARAEAVDLEDAVLNHRPRVHVEITDTGHGMEQSTLERIFEAFFSTKGEHGLGLGLSSVKEIVTLHGGTITARSSPGEGTTFHIDFPEGVPLPLPKLTRTEPPAAEEPLAGKSVLIVDDEHYIRKSTGRLLRQAGARVLEASDGDEALRVYGETEPDVVLLDLALPRMSGEDALFYLRKRHPRALVVLMTGDANQARIDAARSLGAAHVVVKPFTGADLTARISSALASHELDDEPVTARHEIPFELMPDRPSSPKKRD